MITRFRDVSLFELGGEKLTVACDSCAGVGMLDSDIVNASAFYTGYRTAFVALAETLAIGSVPIMLINTLSVSGNGYGAELIEGVYKAAFEAGLENKDAITGSTEENFTIPVTSLGITVLGRMTRSLPEAVCSDCSVYLVGKPVSGKAVLQAKNEILDFATIKKLKADENIIDLLPAGSGGIASELVKMNESLKSSFIPSGSTGIDTSISAGPATCALVAVKKPFDLPDIGIPVVLLGTLRPEHECG